MQYKKKVFNFKVVTIIIYNDYNIIFCFYIYLIKSESNNYWANELYIIPLDVVPVHISLISSCECKYVKYFSMKRR